jgi:hypothetical protein
MSASPNQPTNQRVLAVHALWVNLSPSDLYPSSVVWVQAPILHASLVLLWYLHARSTLLFLA